MSPPPNMEEWRNGGMEDVMPETVDRRTLRRWTKELDALNERISERFPRAELRLRAQTYLRGLLGSAVRKNSWQLAETAGERVRLMASNICWVGPAGTQMRCATT